jgi:hypothetical protein
MAIGLNHYQISWTKLALKDIRKVYKFYSRIASPEIAKKIIFPIFAKVKTISKKPLIG